MMNNDQKFRDLMARVLSGCETAARELFHKYEPYILFAIRQKLDDKIRSKFDSQDFAQDVWASFFAQPTEKRRFGNSKALIGFLTALARHKIIETYRQRFQTEKFDINREETTVDDLQGCNKEKLIADMPTPSFLLAVEDEWRAFLSKQPPVDRRIFILLRAEKSQREIAEEMGIDPSYVNRVIRDRIEELPR